MTKKMIVALAVEDWMADVAAEAEEAEAIVKEAEATWEEKTSAWLADPANYADENYSDIYKDLYGVRPRWLWA